MDMKPDVSFKSFTPIGSLSLSKAESVFGWGCLAIGDLQEGSMSYKKNKSNKASQNPFNSTNTIKFVNSAGMYQIITIDRKNFNVRKC
jgi:hypothetical protein